MGLRVGPGRAPTHCTLRPLRLDDGSYCARRARRAEDADHGPAEVGKIVRFSARHEMTVDHGWRVDLGKTNEEILAECDVDTFRSSGPGGQNVNRRETAVRLRHRPSGIEVVCRETRSQYMNKGIALSIVRARLESRLRSRAPRIRTRATKAARRRTLEGKRRTGVTKRLRRRPNDDD